MEDHEIERAIAAAEEAIADGAPVDRRAFWKAVAAVKARPELIDGLADRIGAVDRALFEDWALLRIPGRVGTIAMLTATEIALVLMGLAYGINEPWNGLSLLAGTGLAIVSTHSLAHVVVGRIQGMRFTDWFVGSTSRPQPGVKVDYATYLRVPAARRAWMHASGALVTKAIPLIALGPALVIPVQPWVTILLVLLAVFMIATDLLLSVKVGEWRKVKREWAYSRPTPPAT